MKLMKNILFLYLLIQIHSDDKIIKLNTRVIPHSVPAFNIQINKKDVEVLFLTTYINSTYKMILKNDKNNPKCYIPDESKNQKKNGTLIYDNKEYKGNVYKDNFSINNKEIKDIEFIFSQKFIFQGAIFFDRDFLKNLQKNNIISKKIISFGKQNQNQMEIKIGEKYSMRKLPNSNYCKMIEPNYACQLTKIATSKSIKDFTNNVNTNTFKFDVLIEVEFSILTVYSNAIIGPKHFIKDIVTHLSKNGFNCTIDHETTNCLSKNTYLFLVFGDVALKFYKMEFVEMNDLKYLYIGYKSLDKLEILFDVEDNKVVFYSDEKDFIIDLSSIFKKALFWILSILIILIIIAVVLFFLYFKKKNSQDVSHYDAYQGIIN